jgi:DNA-binding XRE family transcriptional regulator
LSARPIGEGGSGVLAVPVVVLAQSFPARPSSFPDIRDFVMRALADSPISDEGRREIQMAVADALLEAAGPGDDMIQAFLRIFPEYVEVDVLRTAPPGAQLPAKRLDDGSFAAWMQAVLRREGLSQEAAARQVGVSVKTVQRWVTGATEPRLRELRKLRDAFGDVKIP